MSADVSSPTPDASTPPQAHAAPERPRMRSESDALKRVLVTGYVVVGLIVSGLAALLVRVVQLQTKPPQPIAELIDTQKGAVALHGRRGDLRDIRGRPLAISQPTTTLYVDPMLVEDPNTFSEHVGYRLGLDPSLVAKLVARRPESRYVVVEKALSDEQVQKLKQSRLPRGVATQTQLVRHYPHGSLAGQVIGFVGNDGAGLEGLERVFNSKLAGKPGKLAYLRDAAHRPLWIDQATYVPPTDGEPVYLSIDLTIQSIAETQLAAACEEYGASSGQLIVIEPTTGQILAMANYPFFDPGAFAKAKPEQWRNRCVTDVFEPGSIFKPFIWAPATDWGFARPNEIFDCTTSGVWVTPVGRRLRDAHANGSLTWDGVLMQSSNIGMAKVSLRMGNDRTFAAIRAMGFGQPTGSGLPGEVSGLVTPLKRWTHYTLTSVPMGQEIAATPLQLVRGFCVIANGGSMVTPTILARQANDGSPQMPILERVLSPAAAAHTRYVLRRAVAEGTGRKANSPIYPIFGKTGTAQVADPNGRGYLEGQYVGSFVCGAPLDQPRIVVGCFIHRPDKSKGYYGGIVAAPAAKRVVEQTLIYLGVPPQPTNDSPRARYVLAD